MGYDEVLPEFGAVTEEDFIRPERITEVVGMCAEECAALKAHGAFSASEDVGTLRAIERWVSRGGLKRGEKRELLEKVKDAIFSDLMPRHIRSEYYDALRKLASRLTTTAKTE